MDNTDVGDILKSDNALELGKQRAKEYGKKWDRLEKAIKSGKQIEFAKRTNVQVDKNHVSGAQSRGRLVMTAHGFIHDDDKALKKYKEQHSDEWAQVLGGYDFDITEETENESHEA